VLRRIKEILIDEREVIECDEAAVSGQKALGYRLMPDYRETHRLVCEDEALNSRIWSVQAKDERTWLPIHRWLRGKLDLLEFDMQKASAVIATLQPKRQRHKQPMTRKEYRQQCLEYCRRIADGCTWFSADKYGRVHTPLTALHNDLLCCLSVGGKPLVEIDLANSQPLLLCVMAHQFLLASKRARNRFAKRSFRKNGNPYHKCNQTIHQQNSSSNSNNNNTRTDTRINSVTGHVTTLQNRKLRKSRLGTLPVDFRESWALCEEGKFYESLMTGKEKAKGDKFRRRLKVRFYRVLFGRNRGQGRYPNLIKERFRERHPTLAKVLKELKRKNYRHSSHLLQNFEATMFIYRICTHIRKELPAAPIYTKHDAILTTPGHVEAVKRIIRSEFAELGVTPTLKLKESR
jgi:hypothetical protein